MEYSSKKISELSQIYYENGWVLLNKCFSKKDIEELKTSCFKYLKKNYKKYKGKDINFSGSLQKFEDINSFHKASDISKVKKIAKNNKFNNLIKNFLNNEKPKYMDSEIFAKPALKGLPSPAHQDNYYWAIKGGNAVTVWVALNKADKKNGGIYYFNKSHKIGLVEHVPSYAKGSSQTVKNLENLKRFKKIYPKLNVGDLIIHNSEIVHGSGPNKSKFPRTGLTFQFKSKKAAIDKKQLTKYLKLLDMQLKTRSESKQF